MTSDLFYSLMVYPILFILPAWIANGTPVIFGGGTPLDLNRKLSGKPILGKHKTMRGTASGLLGGFVITALESLFLSYPVVLGVALTFGAVVGDLLGSFIKRRMGLKEGASVLFIDQYLFFVVALAFSLPFGNLPGYAGLVVVAVLTGFLHRIANISAHRLRMKKVPW